MFRKLLRKVESACAPETTTLIKFDIEFKTVDGETHLYSNIAACDESTLKCTALEYYLYGETFLKDNDNKVYPMNNIVSISPVNIHFIENVKRVRIAGGFYRTWYPEKEVHVIEKEN